MKDVFSFSYGEKVTIHEQDWSGTTHARVEPKNEYELERLRALARILKRPEIREIWSDIKIFLVPSPERFGDFSELLDISLENFSDLRYARRLLMRVANIPEPE